MKKLKTTLTVFIALLCTLYMARIDHWDKIRNNIIVFNYEFAEVDQNLLTQLKELDHQRVKILRKLNRRTEIFLPQRSPIVEKGLVKEGRLFEVANCKYLESHIDEKRNIHLIEAVDQVNNLTNIISESVLDKIRYQGEPYKRLTTLVYDDRGVLRIPVVTERNVI